MDAWQIIVGLAVGIGLAAACGFRVFVPLLVVAVAQRAGYAPPGASLAGFDWLGSDVALVVLIAATVAEVAGYYVPWVDNLLDSITTPAASIAGTLMMMGMLDGAPDSIRWGVGIVGGGGTALAVQGVTVLTRGASSVATAGLGNPVVSTVENVGSTLFAVLAVIIGPLVIVAVAVGLWMLVRKMAALRGRAATEVAIAAELSDGDEVEGAGDAGATRRRGRLRRKMSPMLRSKGVVGIRAKREG